MKRIYNFITLAVLAFGAIGCIEDINTDIPSAASGDEVQFGLSLDGPKTKTVYGTEANNAFPVYWVNGDKVAVYSPDCLTGRNSAEYQVSVSEAKNYADQLTKTGEVGIQWGSSDDATFYSIYPSANATISGSGDDVIAALNIPATQMLTHTLVNNTYYASDMNSVIMYAKEKARKSDAAVNLQYTPYSTIIEFELKGDFSQNTKASLFIESLTLTAAAPAEGVAAPYLAGNFNFRFNDTPEISATGNNRSNITLQFSTQPELNNTNNTLKAKMCLMPIGVANLDGWTVSVTLREGDNTAKTLVKTLKTKNGESTALNAGKVHKIILPALTATKEWVYTPGAWMPQLPEYQKIYITELSIPGAWYAGSETNKGYQSTDNFSTLWSAGVRAFGVECRSYTPRPSRFLGVSSTTPPTRICLSGGGSESGGAYTTQYLQSESTITFISEIISDIATQVNNSGEFAILVLNYAYGGKGGYRDLDYKYFLAGLANEITNSGATNIVKDEITSNTTIDDVLNKLIIKVNVDDDTLSGTLASNSYALVSYTPHYTQLLANEELSNKNGPFYSCLTWNSWTSSNLLTQLTTDKFLWSFSSANRTQLDNGTNGDIPTYQQRKDALSRMMADSYLIHERSTHNVWFYFNVGGTQTQSLTDETDDANGTNTKNFATTMNPWLLGIINNKINGYTEGDVHYPSNPSPLGIVMFNQCTSDTYRGPEIIKAIVEMNNKFKLKREGGVENTIVGVDSWDTELL